jgi:adenine/guanine phosphoribosyltransferase-like PRPP-binding protein
MRAAIALLREQGAEVVEAAFIVELGFLGGRQKLGISSAAMVTY